MGCCLQGVELFLWPPKNTNEGGQIDEVANEGWRAAETQDASPPDSKRGTAASAASVCWNRGQFACSLVWRHQMSKPGQAYSTTSLFLNLTVEENAHFRVIKRARGRVGERASAKRVCVWVRVRMRGHERGSLSGRD